MTDVPAIPFPGEPSLEQLRNQAEDLKGASGCRSKRAPTRTTARRSTTGCSSRATTIWSCCWRTALRKTAEGGDLELARTLLRLGADPDIRDARSGSTPLGWARYFGRQALVDLLEPLTS